MSSTATGRDTELRGYAQRIINRAKRQGRSLTEAEKVSVGAYNWMAAGPASTAATREPNAPTRPQVETPGRIVRNGLTPVIYGLAIPYKVCTQTPVMGRTGEDIEGIRRCFETYADGSLAETIANDAIEVQINHDAESTFATTADGSLRLGEDWRGVRYEVRPYDNKAGRFILDQCERQLVKGFSHRCHPIDGGVHPVPVILNGAYYPHHVVLKGRLVEISFVTEGTPSYPNTGGQLRWEKAD